MPFWLLPGIFWCSSRLFLASSDLPGLFLASSGLQGPPRRHFLFINQILDSWSFGAFLASSWPLPGLSWPKSPKFKGSQRRHFLFIKYGVSSSFSPNSGFLVFWCLSWPFPGLFWPLLASYRRLLPLLASSWPLLASFWPCPGCSNQNSGSPETSFSVHKILRFEQFLAKFWIPGLLVPFGAFFRIFLTLSGLFWPLPGLFWPLPGLFWPFPGLFRPGFFWPLPVLFWPLFGFFLDSPKSPKFRRFQRRHFLFIKHCVSSSFSPNSGFLAFWGFFVRNPAYPVVFGRCALAASLRLRLGPVKDNDRRRRCPSPRWDA